MIQTNETSPGTRARTWSGLTLAALVGLAGVGCHHSTTADTAGTASASASAVAMPSPPAPTVAHPGTHADAPFEGEIQIAYYAASAKTPASIAYDIKGDKIRSAPAAAADAAAAAHVVTDLKARKAYAVVDASKSYASVAVDAAAETPAPAVNKTGKMEKVAGRDCEDWVITDAGERFDLCVARGINYVDPGDDGHGGSAEPAWAGVLTKEHAFPMRVIATDKAGKQEFRAEATKVTPKNLDDALFKVPNDYRSVPLTKAVKVASIP